MDLNDYFDPVSIEKPSQILLQEELTIGRNIAIHTPNNPIGSVEGYHLALLGIPEDRNSPNKGSAGAPDRIRGKFYPLFKFPAKIRFIDLGNLKSGDSPADTYFGVRDVLFKLMNNNIIPIILGGSQDNTYGLYLAFEKMKKPVNLVTVDPRIDLSGFRDEFDSQTYLRKILIKKERTFVNYSNIGHQVYFTDQEDLEFLKSSFFELYRLGMVRT
ncbi:MAG: arginase family protein, partial [Bacteroidales bacterium]